LILSLFGSKESKFLEDVRTRQLEIRRPVYISSDWNYFISWLIIEIVPTELNKDDSV
jgi:hypothetical protein